MPFEIVHWKTLFPEESPVTAEFGSFALAMFPLPEINVQAPLPTTGAFAVNVAEVLQMLWSSPARAVVGFSLTVMDTSSETSPQVPPETVHRKTLVPIDKPVTEVAASFSSANMPVPETRLQAPPEAAVALSETDEEQIVSSLPASAVGGVSTTINTSSKTVAQLAVEMVQRKVLFPAESPLTEDVSLFRSAKTPDPVITLQVPVSPACGVLAESETLVAQMV